MTKKARKRITFASLYLGTGTLEQELVCSTALCIPVGRRKFGYMQTQTDKEAKGYNYKTVSTADTGLEKDLT